VGFPLFPGIEEGPERAGSSLEGLEERIFGVLENSEEVAD
jgi:hypothetical protein